MAKTQSESSAILTFNPEKFIGPGWTILETNDTCELGDPSKVNLISLLKPGETYATGDEARKRLFEDKRTPLNADHFLFFWQNQDQIPEVWKKGYILFDGTVLRSPSGGRDVLSLYWDDGEWDWDYDWLGHNRLAHGLSAVFAS